ncbi:hypothetical protein ACIKK6_00545 [Bacillus thuringiensis]|uniref:hypothetical protein n=1 Tax=Bacillus thuringiensis TaxID=1428 RepID=UPI0037D830E8
MTEKAEPKMDPKACYGWYGEEQCVEFQVLINEEIYVMPIYEKDVRGMETWFQLKKHNLIK